VAAHPSQSRCSDAERNPQHPGAADSTEQGVQRGIG